MWYQALEQYLARVSVSALHDSNLQWHASLRARLQLCMHAYTLELESVTQANYGVNTGSEHTV